MLSSEASRFSRLVLLHRIFHLALISPGLSYLQQIAAHLCTKQQARRATFVFRGLQRLGQED